LEHELEIGDGTSLVHRKNVEIEIELPNGYPVPDP
jgi:hypothetical protein